MEPARVFYGLTHASPTLSSPRAIVAVPSIMWSPSSPAVRLKLKTTHTPVSVPHCPTRGFCLCCHNTLCSPSKPVRQGASRKVFDDLDGNQEDTQPALDAMPPDVLEVIAKHAGADLPAFACVSKSIASVMHGALWRSAYEAASPAFDVEGWGGDVMPASLWKACLARRAR